MKIVWILGWAIPAGWFRAIAEEALPAAQHNFVAATPEWESALARCANLDWVVGYSLGAHLLLSENPVGRPLADAGPAARRPQADALPVALLAPFLSFPAEANQGGRVSATQVRYLARWLQRDRPAALADFYQRSGLAIAPDLVETPTDDLLWGLERLAGQRHVIRDVTLRDSMAFAGSEDPLIDSTRLGSLLPNLQQVSGAGHDPAALIKALAGRIA